MSITEPTKSRVHLSEAAEVVDAGMFREEVY